MPFKTSSTNRPDRQVGRQVDGQTDRDRQTDIDTDRDGQMKSFLDDCHCLR